MKMPFYLDDDFLLFCCLSFVIGRFRERGLDMTCIIDTAPRLLYFGVFDEHALLFCTNRYVAQLNETAFDDQPHGFSSAGTLTGAPILPSLQIFLIRE